jgi:hypothetical protein
MVRWPTVKLLEHALSLAGHSRSGGLATDAEAHTA